MAAKLTVVATPLGNLGDLSPRARAALEDADFWLVEDTRVSGKLASHLGLKKPMSVLNEHTHESRIAQYVERIREGASAALLSDAGCPCISDPGAIIVDRCYESEVDVDAIPGPSAVTTALMLSGFFAQRFCFLGFLPRKPGAIKQELLPFGESSMTLVLFESSFRIEKLLEAAQEILGNRRYVICRELTKMHQQIYREILPVVPDEKQLPRKGEVTLVIEGKRKAYKANEGTW